MMKPLVFKALSFFLLVLITFLPAPASADRLALVIGNDNYQNLRALEKARNDADAVAATLQGLGFDVALLQDADRRTMTKALSDVASQITPGSEVMFYFAGHGVEISGRNYLIPTDAPAAGPEDEAFLTAESVAVDQVLSTLQSRGARVTVLVLDACRDNPFPSNGTRAIGSTRGLAPIAAPEGAFILFSAGTGQAALDGMGAGDADPNSVFTRTLLPLLAEPGVPFQDVARGVRGTVEELAASVNHKQRPAYYDELTGDFFLIAPEDRGATALDDDVTAGPLGRPIDDPCADAARDWPSVEQFGDAGLLRAFADTHRKCAVFSRAAMERAEALEETPPTAAVTETWRVKMGISAGYMNVRTGRGTSFPILFRIAEGTGGLTVLECAPPETGKSNFDWCLIDHRGQQGWLSKGGIELE
jgi:hypothetical protein